MNEWQPIETAPKDGTVIDLFVRGERRPNCRWCPHYRTDLEDGEHGWEQAYSHVDLYDFVIGNPTHWMPLPPPPSTPKQGEGE